MAPMPLAEQKGNDQEAAWQVIFRAMRGCGSGKLRRPFSTFS